MKCQLVVLNCCSIKGVKPKCPHANTYREPWYQEALESPDNLENVLFVCLFIFWKDRFQVWRSNRKIHTSWLHYLFIKVLCGKKIEFKLETLTTLLTQKSELEALRITKVRSTLRLDKFELDKFKLPRNAFWRSFSLIWMSSALWLSKQCFVCQQRQLTEKCIHVQKVPNRFIFSNDTL